MIKYTFNFIYKYFPFNKKYLTKFAEFFLFLIPKNLTKKKLTINCDYQVKLNLPLEILVSWGVIFTGRIHPIETEIIRKFFIKKPSNIMLLGGFRDGFLLLAINDLLNQYNKKGYVVEPIQEFYENLSENITINNAKNITPLKIGISDKKGKETMFLNEGETSFEVNSSLKSEIVEVDTFENILKDQNIKLDFLIIDIEKREFYVLENAISRGIYFIMFEVLFVERNKIIFEKINNLCLENNYEFFKISRTLGLSKISSYNDFYNSEIFNFILKKPN